MGVCSVARDEKWRFEKVQTIQAQVGKIQNIGIPPLSSLHFSIYDEQPGKTGHVNSKILTASCQVQITCLAFGLQYHELCASLWHLEATRQQKET